MIILPVARSFTEKPKGSNVMEQKLSIVKRRTEMRFLMMEGEISTSRREKVEREVEPTAVMGSREPSPTRMPEE